MKILSVFLLAIFLCQGSEAKPFLSKIVGSITGGISKIADKTGKIVSDMAKGWGNIANGIITKVSDASKGAINASVKFVSGMANGMASVTITVAEKFANITQSVEDTIKSVTGIGGQTFKKISNDIMERINMVREQVEEVLHDVENKYNEGLKKLNETLIENNGKIDNIAAELREKYKANDENKEKIEKIINDFVYKSTNEISECAKEIVEPMQGLYNETVEAINGVLPPVQKVVDDLQVCVKDSSNGKTKLVKCAMEAKKGLPGVSTMFDFIKNMKKEVGKYNFAELMDLTCISESWEKIKKMREEMEKKIEEIVDHAEKKEIPDEKTDIPDETTQTPNERTEIPEEKTEMPEEKPATPEGITEVTEEGDN